MFLTSGDLTPTIYLQELSTNRNNYYLVLLLSFMKNKTGFLCPGFKNNEQYRKKYK